MKKLLLVAVLVLKVSLYAFANTGHSASLTLGEFTAAHNRDTALTGHTGNFDGNASGVTANAATNSNALSSNANLANLIVVGQALSPAFSPSTLQYTVSLDASYTSVRITPTAADADADIRVNGQVATSGSPSFIVINGGDNLVPIVVTAADGTAKTYTINIKRALSTDNTLSSLTMSWASISPNFDKNVLNYTATVGGYAYSVNLTFSNSEIHALTKLNGVTRIGTTTLPLVTGNNTFTFDVTAENGAVKKYKLVVTKLPDNNAYLSGLSLLQGQLGTFSELNLNYSAFVTNNISSVNVMPTVSNVFATVKVNGNTVSPGGHSADIPLSVGANTIPVTVTAEDGVTIRTYTITVNRAKPGLLSTLTLSTGTIPGFNRYILNYNFDVASSTTSITVTPTAADAGTVITVNGVAVISGAASQTITLKRGQNTITIQATDASGDIQNYVLRLYQPQSNDNNLSNLTVSQGTLSPAFNTDIFKYEVFVPSSVTSVTLSPTLRTTSGGLIKVNDLTVASGSTSQALPLQIGENNIYILCISEVGQQRFYTVTVTRVRSEVLSDLTLSAGTLSSVFTPSTLEYSATVTDDVSSLTVLPALTSAAASVKINGVTTASGSPSAAIPLQIGLNTITVEVEGKVLDDSRTYTIKVSRVPDLRLDNLVISDGTLTPAFNKDTLTYKVTVFNPTSSIIFTATPHYAGATMKIDGVPVASSVPSPLVMLSEGEGGHFIQVSAGGITKTYVVLIKRLPPLLLSGMFISSGTLTQVGATDNYTASVSSSVSSVTMKIGTQSPATIKVNGNITAQNTNSAPITLTGTSTTFLVELLGVDGINKRIISITVKKAGSNSTAMNYIAVNTGPITRIDASVNWQSTVLFNVTSVKVTLGTKDPATIKINGVVTAQLTASAPVTLTGVTTTIPVEITAEDGVTKLLFNIIIHRPPASNNTALAVTSISSGMLVRVGTTNNYTASVSTGVSSVTIKLSTVDPATIKINGIITAQNATSAPITLTGATTTFPVEITAQDGITKRNISITVKTGSSNNTEPSYIAVDAGAVTRVGTTANWESTVDYTTTSVKITLGTKEPGRIRINGVTTAQLTASAPIAITWITTVIPVEITAEDGVTKLLFNITIHRPGPSGDTGLKFIAVSTGPVTKVGTTDDYVSYVSSSVNSVQITLAMKYPGTMRINGVTTAQNTASAPITLTGTATEIPVVLIAQSGISTGLFTITINRTGSNSTWLSNMSISAGTLTQVGTTDNYTASVSSSVSSVTMKIGTKSPATIKVNGVSTAQNTASAPVTLTGTATTFPVEITAEDGTTKRNISITVNKAGSNNTALNYIAVNTGPITRVGTTNNWVSTVNSTVSSVKITLRTKDPATIKINGVTTAQFTESAPITLTGAATAIPVEIKAEDGVTTPAFTITINKTPPPGFAAVNKNRNTVDVLQKQEPSTDAPEALTVKQALSPNGDGINDRLTIAGINAYPENTVRIMNRNGDVVYEAKGYDNESKAFDGRGSKGTLQQPGTYFYSIEYKKGTETLRKTGYMVLKY